MSGSFSRPPQPVSLKKRRQFQEVYNRGKRFHHRCFILFLLRQPNPGIRFGLTVTRKIGNAVVRNRVKRILREAVRMTGHLIPDGSDIVILAKRPAVRASSTECADILERFFRRISRERDEIHGKSDR